MNRRQVLKGVAAGSALGVGIGTASGRPSPSERTPDDLRTQEEVSLTESVEAIEEGLTQPGSSCGNCAEFIPDRNGDTWGACAKVEGYVAVEDWCTLWEHVGAEH